MTKEQLLERLAQMVEEAGSQEAFAASIGFSPGFLSDIRKGRRDPSDRFCAAIGYRKVVSYESQEGG